MLPYGAGMAKISPAFLDTLKERADGRLVLVTAISPTPAGEGKTTSLIGLGDALNRLGQRTAICLREPSLGPCFGMKGGAAGGGYSQVVPMEQINLHFTGDFHAITSAHNLLAAMIDNHVHWGNALGLDRRRISWRRAMDMNDRALRSIISSLGGAANGYPREDGFDITVASEVMAVFCLARDLADLEARLGRMVIGYRRDKSPVTAADLKAPGAMTVLLKDALSPNLVQTLEGNPAFVHGGPFANIAHGCNSVIATRAALKLADFVVTEAGFGADLGAAEVLRHQMPQGRSETGGSGGRGHAARAEDAWRRAQGPTGRTRIWPQCNAVLPTWNGMCAISANTACRRWSPSTPSPPIPMPNTNGYAKPAANNSAWKPSSAATGPRADAARGSGAMPWSSSPRRPRTLDGRGFRLLYPDDLPLWEKVRMIATEIYHAGDIIADKKIRDRFRELQAEGYGDLPVCIAKTQYSFSTDPDLLGAPSGHTVPDARSAPGRRRRLHRGHLRRDHDHARAAQSARSRAYSYRRSRTGAGVVLGARDSGLGTRDSGLGLSSC